METSPLTPTVIFFYGFCPSSAQRDLGIFLIRFMGYNLPRVQLLKKLPATTHKVGLDFA